MVSRRHIEIRIDDREYRLAVSDARVLRRYQSMIEDAEWCAICVAGGQMLSSGTVATTVARAAFALFPTLRCEG